MAKEEKTEGQKLADELCFTLKNCWEDLDEKGEKEVEKLADSYKHFLDNGKTERECTSYVVEVLEKHGFVNVESLKGKPAAGAKVYQNIKGKALIAAVIGKKPAVQGCNIIGSHIDSPRLDLKQNPVYEESGMAYLDTHYYGGIKKYQWMATPLAMHGVFVKEDGSKVTVRLGEEPGDPVFCITDLLPHLGADQMQKKLSEAFEGENLDILAGSRPYNDKEVKDKVKLNILSLLNKKYGITEKHFASAEIEFVPAFGARDIGFDRSMIGAYGHDDRCCAWPTVSALLAVQSPEKTSICYLSDKEEIGSMGNTGAQSASFKNFFAFLCDQNDADIRACLCNSSMLSADVGAAFDPFFADCYEKKNAPYLGKGLVLTKYTGSRGKSGASDANAEFCAKVQNIMAKNNVQWQFGELGKVDKGGGGTIALFAANMGIEVLDCGLAVLSMHAPFEVISKIDLYMACKGYVAFFQDC